MKTTMKLAALAALAMGCSTAALADNNSVEFKTSIQVVGADYCGLDVSAAGKNAWGLTWTLDKADAETGTLAMKDDSTADPLSVKVKFKPGSASKCTLGSMTFGAELAQATHLDDGNKGAFKKATPNGGFWRYMPVVAKLALFTDEKGADDGASGLVDLATVKVRDAAGTEHTQAAAAQSSAKADITNDAFDADNKAMSLTDNYLAANGVAPLSTGTGTAGLTYSLTTPLEEGKTVKGALIGVGALVAGNPEGEDGKKKLDVVADGQSVSLPFTVVVNNP